MVWFWSLFSEDKLSMLENKILSVLKTSFITKFVKIEWEAKEQKIWTISLNTKSSNTPLVLLHGFAAGIGFWVRNLDHLSRDRPVYAIDLLGFGRSSRPEFSNNGLEAERQMIDAIEAWRKKMKLDKFILLGHSLGGYLATSYAISYPQHVKHLILGDPWGFVGKAQTAPRNSNPPLKFKILLTLLYPFTYFNPLATIRALGPLGPWWISKLRGDIIAKFDDVLEDRSIIANYICQCNSQNPTGETAFYNMFERFGWAKYPMISRIQNLNAEVPITFIYGSLSFIENAASRVQDLRPRSYVDVKIIDQAGHHIYADQVDEFNEIVNNLCSSVDKSEKNMPKVIETKNEKSYLKEEFDDKFSDKEIEIS